jgi:hypothetical protein
VDNAGDQTGTYEAILRVDDAPVASKNVTISPRSAEPVVFQFKPDDPGTYDLVVAETALGTLTVQEATPNLIMTNAAIENESQSIVIQKATLPADWVRSGYETTVRATVVNTANYTANRTFTVTVGDRPVANQSVTVQPDERAVVRIEFQATNGTVSIGGVEAGRIRVGGGPPDNTGPVETSQPPVIPNSPTFLVPIGIGATLMITLLYFAHRRVG